MNFLLIFFTSLIFTIFITPYFISYLKRSKVVDLPGNRRIHTSIVPRMGGLVIFLISFVMLLSFYDDLNNIRLFIIAANIILMVGIFDDMLGLDYSAKFMLQVFAAILLIFFLAPKFNELQLFGIIIPNPFDYILLGLFIIGGINSINLLDGMDGLVNGFSLLVFSVIMALAVILNDTFLLILTSSLVGGLLGFLKFNAYPAKIFLGDTGALTLGFFLVVTSILTSINFNIDVLDLTFPVMLMAIPLIDTVKVMLFRIIRRQNPFLPDRTHLHHIINSNSISQKYTVFLIESFTVIFIILALYYLKIGRIVPLFLFFLFSVVLLFVDPLIKWYKHKVKIDLNLQVINRISKHALAITEKILILSSTIIIGIIIISTLPQKNTISSNILILFFVIGLIMFMLAYGYQKKSKDISDIYTFINLTAFFVITNLNSTELFSLSTYNEAGNMSGFSLGYVTEISYYILTFIIIIFLIANEKLFPVKKIVLTGIDLTLIVFILLVMIANNFIQFHYDEFFSISFMEGFLFYFWYKIIITIKSEITYYLFYGSFALPFAAILLMLFN